MRSQTMKRYALIGAAGYIAPRHMQAIADVGGELVAACDPHDSVGVLDRHFPQCRYFPEIERFERYLDKLRREGNGVDYVSICSPNWLHDAHVRLALRNGADAICEKPVVLKRRNIDALLDLEVETGRRVWPVLQLRCAPELIAARKDLMDGNVHNVTVIYNAPRGGWYGRSWKGDAERSGGPIMNIGIHVFDLLLWMFGPQIAPASVARDGCMGASGSLTLRRAQVSWELSVRATNAAQRTVIVSRGPYPYVLDLSSVLTGLHSTLYRRVLDGTAPTLEDAAPAIELIEAMG